MATVLAVGGIAGSAAAASAVARNDSRASLTAFQSSSAAIASTLELTIRQEESLIVSAGAFVAGNPTASNAELNRWAVSVQALTRYPELSGFGHAVVVPAAQLAAFAARSVIDPAGPLAPDGTFQVIPAGKRSFYCLLVGQVSRPAAIVPAGLDFCAGTERSLSARDSGRGSYAPLQAAAGLKQLSVMTPVYRDGITPSTVAARRAAFMGWVGMAVVPEMLLDRALRGHPHTAVAFRYHDADSDAAFTSGTAARRASSVTTDLHNGWTVTTSGFVANHGVFANTNARWLLIIGAAMSVLLGLLVFVLGFGRELALRVVGARTGELLYQAMHDSLTGLPNRALILDRIDQLLARSRRTGTLGAALYLDLDDFKNVNDTLGHATGDRLLVAVAARLAGALRDVDTIGRMGGDEFVVLIDGAILESAPELVAQRLLDVMRQPFELDGALTPLLVSISIGIATDERAGAGELLRDADVALYQAKATGKNRYEVFHPEMRTKISRRIDLEFDLRSAVASGQFRLMYQPIYNLDDLAIVGVEALLRWDHPTLGAVSPDEFVPILEQTGQIRSVGRWVLRQACDQMATWHARGNDLDISVNVSGRQLDDDGIVEDIRDALRISGLSATSLVIEVTETALMRDTEATALRLQAIKTLGVRIAIDDFGTGYSSLAYLRQFPVDCLKIDRMFTNAITASPESRALVGTLVQLGKDLGLSTLAEGIETTDEMDLLRAAHVDQAQGFLLARPLDAQSLESHLLVPTRPPAAWNR
jgi:diguanylate cyclase (GGDEF)-like protein